MRDLAPTSSFLPLFIVAYQNWKHIPCPGVIPGTSRMESNKSNTELCSPHVVKPSIEHNRWLMVRNTLNMMEKMMDPSIIDYYIINCAIPSIITIENCYQINFGKPDFRYAESNSALYFRLIILFSRQNANDNWSDTNYITTSLSKFTTISAGHW